MTKGEEEARGRSGSKEGRNREGGKEGPKTREGIQRQKGAYTGLR